MDLVVGNSYPVTVVKCIKAGAIVTLSDESTELIPLCRISKNYIKDVREYISTGHIYTAVAVVGNVRPVELSLLHLDLQPQKVEQLARPTPKTRKKQTDDADTLDAMIAQAESVYADKVRSNQKSRDRYIKHIGRHRR